MNLTNFLDNVVSNNLLRDQESSKRKMNLQNTLSGSSLGNPLQSQILHILGVPPAQFDPYTLKKFERGHHVEAWLKKQLPGVLDRKAIQEYAKTHPEVVDVDEEDQAVIEYRNTTGHIDGLCDMVEWNQPELGIIPHECKSVKNSQWKYISTAAGAKTAHKMQNGLYALAIGAEHYMIHYVAADDYRIVSFLFKTRDIEPQVNAVIDEVHEQLRTGEVPVWAHREEWQLRDHLNGKEYENYPMWSSLEKNEIMEKLQTEYPTAYERLMSFKK